MLEDIAKIINEYNSRSMYINNEFVNRVCISYVNANKLNKYLDYVTTSDPSLKRGTSNYNPITKVLSLDLVGGNIPPIQILLGDKYLYFDNLQKLRMLLHELEHINQEKILEKNDGSIEYELVKLNNYNYFYPSFLKNDKDATLIDTIKGTIKLYKYGRYYKKNHDNAPIERLANIKSYNRLSNILDNVRKEKMDRAYYEYIYYAYKEMEDYLKCGYKLKGDKTNSPSVDFLVGLKDLKYIVDEYDFEEASKDLSFEERVLYGLSLSKEEYKNIDKANPYDKIRKKLNIY